MKDLKDYTAHQFYELLKKEIGSYVKRQKIKEIVTCDVDDVYEWIEKVKKQLMKKV